MLLFIGSVARNIEQSNLLATFFIMFFMLFDGNWISLDNVPRAYRWIEHISWMGFGVQAAVVSEMKGLVSSSVPSSVPDSRLECVM